MKKILKILLIIVVAIILIMVGFMVLISWGAKDRKKLVDDMCRFPPGTSIEEIIREGEKLGFKNSDTVFDEIAIRQEGMDLPVRVSARAELDQLNNGQLIYAKIVVAPFLRHYCTLTIQDRKLVSGQRSAID